MIKNKKLGFILIGAGFFLGAILLALMSQLENITHELCNCSHSSDKMLMATHIGFGVIFSIISLGFYLLFFEKSEIAILDRLDEEKKKKAEEGKFETLLRGMDDYEQMALMAIKKQEGITQNTLRLRTDMSSAKLSLVLSELEKRGLIKKVKKGKTFSVYLKEDF